MVSFKARRREPELVPPARPTPRETKALSDIDDQHALRYYETVIGFFRRCTDQNGVVDGPDDPVQAARAALVEALVYYYPVAGRLREDAGGKLVVDCTAEGVAFVEADADVRLEDFGEPLLPRRTPASRSCYAMLVTRETSLAGHCSVAPHAGKCCFYLIITWFPFFSFF